MRLRALRQIELDTPQRFNVCVRVRKCVCVGLCVTERERVLMYLCVLVLPRVHVVSVCVHTSVYMGGWLFGGEGNQRARCYSPFPEKSLFMDFTSFRKWTNVMAPNRDCDRWTVGERNSQRFFSMRVCLRLCFCVRESRRQRQSKTEVGRSAQG